MSKCVTWIFWLYGRPGFSCIQHLSKLLSLGSFKSTATQLGLAAHSSLHSCSVNFPLNKPLIWLIWSVLIQRGGQLVFDVVVSLSSEQNQHAYVHSKPCCLFANKSALSWQCCFIYLSRISNFLIIYHFDSISLWVQCLNFWPRAQYIFPAAVRQSDAVLPGLAINPAADLDGFNRYVQAAINAHRTAAETRRQLTTLFPASRESCVVNRQVSYLPAAASNLSPVLIVHMSF